MCFFWSHLPHSLQTFQYLQHMKYKSYCKQPLFMLFFFFLWSKLVQWSSRYPREKDRLKSRNTLQHNIVTQWWKYLFFFKFWWTLLHPLNAVVTSFNVMYVLILLFLNLFGLPWYIETSHKAWGLQLLRFMKRGPLQGLIYEN